MKKHCKDCGKKVETRVEENRRVCVECGYGISLLKEEKVVKEKKVKVPKEPKVKIPKAPKVNMANDIIAQMNEAHQEWKTTKQIKYDDGRG